MHEKQIISYIANHNCDITSWKIDGISNEEIYEILDNLKAEGLFKEDNYTLGFKKEDTVYIKLFKKFGGSSNFKTFYFTKYSQSTIPKCFENFDHYLILEIFCVRINTLKTHKAMEKMHKSLRFVHFLVELLSRLELPTSSLPRMCSTD